jgi:ribosomal protein S14
VDKCQFLGNFVRGKNSLEKKGFLRKSHIARQGFRELNQNARTILPTRKVMHR